MVDDPELVSDDVRSGTSLSIMCRVMRSYTSFGARAIVPEAIAGFVLHSRKTTAGASFGLDEIKKSHPSSWYMIGDGCGSMNLHRDRETHSEEVSVSVARVGGWVEPRCDQHRIACEEDRWPV